MVSSGRSNFVLFWLVIRGRMERDVAVKRSKSSRRRRPGSKRRRTRMRMKTRRARREKGGGGTGMEIKKNPTIILLAKNATTYVEDGTGTLEPEG